MSYASVAAANAPPPHLQPHPDPALLNTDPTANPPQQPEPLSDDHDEPKKKENPRLKEVKAEGLYLWHVAKHHLLQPGIAGGLIGVVNIGLLAGAGCAFYNQPHLRRDQSVISSTVAAGVALLSVEGYLSERYRKQRESSMTARLAVSAVVLGAVGYISYVHTALDRRALSAATAVGLLALWGVDN